MTEDTIKFKVSSKVARLLGRESVSSDTAALFELIKNGYDADASKVAVTFENIKDKDPKNRKIIVSDDGDGISFSEFENKWMLIGTYSKEKETFSRRGRRMLGNKGVGRFATEKIAKYVTMISKPRFSDEEITLEVDWKKYENEDEIFNEIPNKISVNQNRPDKQEHGLKIILNDLRGDWNAKKISRLQDSISSMIIPKELEKITKDPFEVIVNAPEFQIEIKPKVDSLLFENAPFKISAALPSESYRTTVTIQKEGKTVIQPSINLNVELRKTGQKWKTFGKCKVTFYYYPWRSQYEDWDEYYRDVLHTGEIRNTLKDYRGIKLYRDGFWVRPYGGPDDDWLDLEAERVQSNLKVGNSQVIGFVEITKDGNPQIIDTTTRERLDENDAFESLREFVKRVVDELSDYRIEEHKRLRDRSPRILHENVILSEIKRLAKLSGTEEEMPKDYAKLFLQGIRKIEREFKKYKKENVEQLEKSENEERGFRNLASLGITSASSYHEIFNIIGGMGETPPAVLNLLSDDNYENENVKNLLDELGGQLETISQFTWIIRQYVKAIGNDMESKLKKEWIELDETIRKLVEGFMSATDSSIKVDLQCNPTDLTAYMHRADLVSIILNFLTNSIKALDKSPPEKLRKIKINISRGAFDLNLQFSDNGKGIDDDDRPKIFRAFFTTYENGTGLGLTIVREIVESYGGKINLLTEPELGEGTTLVISIPIKNLKKMEAGNN